MNKSRPKAVAEADIVSNLLEFAEHIHLPNGALDLEIEDCCDDDARRQAELIQNETLMAQIEFLLAHQYAPSRIKELMRQSQEENS